MRCVWASRDSETERGLQTDMNLVTLKWVTRSTKYNNILTLRKDCLQKVQFVVWKFYRKQHWSLNAKDCQISSNIFFTTIVMTWRKFRLARPIPGNGTDSNLSLTSQAALTFLLQILNNLWICRTNSWLHQRQEPKVVCSRGIHGSLSSILSTQYLSSKL